MKKLFFYLTLITSLTCSFQAKAETKTTNVEIGSGFMSISDYGFGDNSKNYSSQMLYTPSEIGRPCTITELAFAVATHSGTTIGSLQIYMGETDLTKLNSSNTVSISSLTEVYNSNNFTFGVIQNSEWESVTLQKPYSYSGQKNLVVAIKSTKSNTISVKYYYSDKSGTIVKTNNNANFTSMEYQKSTPDTRLSIEYFDCSGSHTPSNTYSINGFGVCKDCGQEIKTVFEAMKYNENSSTSGYYDCTKLGNLMWYAQQHNSGAFNGYKKQLNIKADITIDPTIWTAIGTSSYPLETSINGAGNINGLNADQYLVAALGSNGIIQNIRMDNGMFVGISKGGTIRYCLTLGSKLVNSGNFTNTASFCKDGSNDAELANGAITYALNNSGGKTKMYWHQNIGTDPYPVLDNTHGIVYHYIQCDVDKYSNSSTNNEKNLGHTLQNGVCKEADCPNPHMTTINQDVNLYNSYSYIRKNNAVVNGTIKYTFTINQNEMGKWQSLYLPFSFQYTAAEAEKYTLAELKGYSASTGTMKISLCQVGNIAQACTPHLILPKQSTINITACDNNLVRGLGMEASLYNGDVMFAVVPNFTANYAMNNGDIYLTNNQMTKAAAGTTLNTFSWIAHPDNDVASAINLNKCYSNLVLTDNESNTYTQEEDILVENLTYSRQFTAGQAGKWQAFYVPFSFDLTDEILDVAEFGTFEDVVTMADGSDAIVINKEEVGSTIEANTPCMIRIKGDQAVNFALNLNDVYISEADNYNIKLYSTNYTYTFTGVYAPYSNLEQTWYGISKTDGMFHPAKVAFSTKLPPYRLYMTITRGGITPQASEIRFTMFDKDEMTGINEVNVATPTNDIYSIEGHKVQSESLRPGLYIQNGKKMMVR